MDETQQLGVVITLDTIYMTVKDVPELVTSVKGLNTRLEIESNRIRSMQNQIAAMWVTHCLTIAVFGTILSRSI